MNQLADDNVQNVKSSLKATSTKNKNKTAKDNSPSKTTDEVRIVNEENLSAALASTLHVNNINSNLTNGTSDHSKEDKAVDKANAVEEVRDVNSIKSNDSNGDGRESCGPQSDAGRSALGATLGNLENTCYQQGQSSQGEIDIISYESELQMPEIMRVIQKDLSEPYSIYTYRYFIHNWPKLCFLATHDGKCIGAIVCKLDMHRNVVKRGYIAMLAVDEKYRNKKIGSRLVRKAIQAMINDNADEVVLETEITNKPALILYENLGFVRDKRLFRYYLNGVDALRLKLWLR
ncbi:N-alpha-acetyltransferase 30 [Leguminivora glycinivorella]|uniref:N-alpha-acetyltransferase 30 n=1 Tax=Leguminivora glycinivorella TaxID=1035111 RepID=UPI00200FC2EE|nr:N-alpha-acetyltransferase 30 [Leguminivora glycinivorella]